MSIDVRMLSLLYTPAGARERFEDLMVLLIKGEHPEANHPRVKKGDSGIDVFVGELTDPSGIDVFQVKYFPKEIGEAQQNQIRESFKTVTTDKEFKLKTWTLCLPIDMSIDELSWYEKWKAKQTGVEIKEVWGETKIRTLLLLDKYRSLRDFIFQEETPKHLREIKESLGTLTALVPEKGTGKQSAQPDSTLASKLQDALAGGSDDFVAMLRMSLMLATQAGRQDLVAWLKAELAGYSLNDCPPHRLCKMQYIGFVSEDGRSVFSVHGDYSACERFRPIPGRIGEFRAIHAAADLMRLFTQESELVQVLPEHLREYTAPPFVHGFYVPKRELRNVLEQLRHELMVRMGDLIN